MGGSFLLEDAGHCIITRSAACCPQTSLGGSCYNRVASLHTWVMQGIRVCCLRAAELGGTCTFCGAKIALVHSVRSEERPPAAERRGGQSAAAGSPAGASGDAAATEKAAEAVAFKDRLVRGQRFSAASMPAKYGSVNLPPIRPDVTCA